MVETKANEAAPATAPGESPAAASAASNSNAAQTAAAGKTSAAGAHRANAAKLDEMLAREALAKMKRTRTAAVTAPIKARSRTPIPPAKLVVKPSPPAAQPWKGPFATLAGLVVLSTFLCGGATTYVLLRPTVVASVSQSELRDMREQVSQLKRTVATLSNDLAASRRLAQNAERIDRVQPASAALAAIEQRAPFARPMPPNASSDITGSVPQQSQQQQQQPAPQQQQQPAPQQQQQPQQRPAAAARRDVVISGWRVRRAYGDVVILEGVGGVIEVMLGQDVPDLGRIEEIKNENNRWRVVTSRGVILSAQ